MQGFFKGLPVLALAGALGAQAAEYTDSAPVELVSLLTGGSEFYRELPPGFPAFDMPAGLSVIGARHAPPLQQVLLRSLPAGEDAQRTLVADLLGRGWIDMSTTAPPRRETGFIIPDDGRLLPARLCHDEHGVLEVRGESGVENRVYLSLFLSGQPSCATRPTRDPRLGIGGISPAIMRYMPVLQAGERQIDVPYISSFGSGDSSIETQQNLRSEEWSVAEVGEHYAEQMREQGWRREPQWAGDLTAGSAWTLHPEEGMALSVRLSIMQVRDEFFDIRIKLAGEEQGAE